MRKLITDIAFISTNNNILILIPIQKNFDFSECSAEILNTDLVLTSPDEMSQIILSISTSNAEWINKIVIQNGFMIAGVADENIENMSDCYQIDLDE